jgi:hypothetical protein
VHRNTASGESKDSDVVRIASERGYVLPHPLEDRNLVHVGVVALGLIRMFLAKRRESEESETPHPVIGSDQDDALFSEPGPRGEGRGARAAREPAPVNPDHYGKLRARGGTRRPPQIDKNRQSSDEAGDIETAPGRNAACAQSAPNSFASRTPCHGDNG